MRTALITGASRGIGLAIASKLAAEQYDLFLTCKNRIDDLEKTAKTLEAQYGITCHVGQVDGADSQAVNAFVSGIPSLDVLVNNAGISYVGLISDMTDEDWNRVWGANLNSVFYYSRAAIPLFLKKREGYIINISSVWGNVGASCEVAYSASKAAVNGFTKALAKELAPNGINVNAIACGLVDTDMNRCFSKEELDEVISEIPMDRMADSEEIAQMVVQMLKAPAYMTGQIITVDGGWT